MLTCGDPLDEPPESADTRVIIGGKAILIERIR